MQSVSSTFYLESDVSLKKTTKVFSPNPLKNTRARMLTIDALLEATVYVT